MAKRKRIRHKIAKRQWVARFGAIKATRRSAWTVQNGQLSRRSLTLLHLPLDPETVDAIRFLSTLTEQERSHA
jgi:hypothetical protein